MSILKKILYSFLAVLAIGLLFYLLLLYRNYNPVTHSYTDASLQQGPFTVLREVYMISLNGSNLTIVTATLNTFKHFFLSFFLACLFGIMIGVFIGTGKTANRVSEYFLNFFRVLPSIVFITIFKYQMKLTGSYVYYVGIIASIWPVIINTKAGVAKVNKTLRESMKILNLPRKKKLLLFTLPEASPDIYNGIKTSMGISFLIAITCEYLFKDLRGLGSFLGYYEVDCAACIVHSMFVILFIGFIGILLNFILEFIETRSTWLIYQFSIDDEENK